MRESDAAWSELIPSAGSADRHIRAVVQEVNSDGSYQALLDNTTAPTRCEPWTSAAAGDRILVTRMADGKCAAVGRLGGEPHGDEGAILPEVGASDNGKVLTVVNGAWLASKLPTYAGSYSVTPTADGLTVPTAGSYMESDVTVNPIPYSETSNTSGGSTIYIASEVDK